MFLKHLMPSFPFLRVQIRVEGVCAISLQARDGYRRHGCSAYEGMIRVDGASPVAPVKVSALECAQFRCHEVVPSEVDDAVTGSVFATVSGNVGQGEQLEGVHGSPFFKSAGIGTGYPSRGGPGVGVEVEVANQECGDEGVQVEGKERGEHTRIIDVVIEVN